MVRQGLVVNVTLMLTPRCQVYRALQAELMKIWSMPGGRAAREEASAAVLGGTAISWSKGCSSEGQKERTTWGGSRVVVFQR